MLVCKQRLEQHFLLLSKIGGDSEGGFTRLAFSDNDCQVRETVISMMRKVGLTVRIDDFGNIIGRREGLNCKTPVVMMGSHIDSVPHGGNYDGIVGVLGAIEVIDCLEERGITTDHPLEVVVFMAEESSRFGKATLGSKAFCGGLTYEDISKLSDKQGMCLADVMRQRQLCPENVKKARYSGRIKAFLELHIEQGKVLEVAKKTIGIVSTIAAPTRLRVIVKGNADHSGATPMGLRKDALAAAAEIILQVEAIAKKWSHQGIVGTTGTIQAFPGAINVIPGMVQLGIDIRGTCRESKSHMLQDFKLAIAALQIKRGVDIEINTISDEEPVQLSKAMVEFLSSVCEKTAHSWQVMTSGAGHDSMHVASFTHTGMLFIPCRGGISHNPAEWADMEDIAAGTQILLNSILNLAAGSFLWEDGTGIDPQPSGDRR